MRLVSLSHRLGEAETFAEVGVVVCEHVRTRLDIYQSTVNLFTTERRFAMMVDDVPHGYSDAQRTSWIARSPLDPQVLQMLEHHGAVGEEADVAGMAEYARRNGYTGAMLNMRVLPLIEPTGLLGFIRSGTSGSLSRALRRDLDVVAAYASARLVQLGVTAVDDPRTLGALAPRQREVAELAARGLTNSEIALTSGTSVNTVKMQLKTVFARLDVTNRAELAARLARTTPRDPLPAGVSQLGEVWVTKAAPAPAPRRREAGN